MCYLWDAETSAMGAANGTVSSLSDYVLEGTGETLLVDLRSTGALSFTGVSLCVRPTEVYADAVKWLREYVEQPAQATHVLFSIKYFNTSTSKVILEILQILEGLFRSGKEVEVHWRYKVGDLDMEDAGAGYAENTLLPFHMEEF